METLRAPALHPALLPLGTVVDSWRMVAWAGRGVHGAVYRVVPVHSEQAPPRALKLALLPRNPRFAREAQLLSRIHHPHIPRLWEHGNWQHSSGTLHPFLVMDWVAGAPLYDWAWHHNPSSQQVLRLLAQMARALQSLHAQGVVHRDVKGDNILVSHTEGRAFLTDLGAGSFQDADCLTPEMLPPSTPAYRAPQAWLFARQFLHERTARYCAGPADDLYALGVTSYRLVTGEYPELAEPSKDEAGLWHLKGLASPPPRVLNPRVEPRLDALILRMLLMDSKQRGTAGELAEALEQAAQLTTHESARPLFIQQVPPSALLNANASSGPMPALSPWGRVGSSAPAPQHVEAGVQVAEVPSRTQRASDRVSPPEHKRPWRFQLATAAGVLVLGSWAGWSARESFSEQPSGLRQEADDARLEDGGTAGLGDDAASTSTDTSRSSSLPRTLAEDALPEPLPGQARTTEKGKCLHKRQVPLNGSCWMAFKVEHDACESIRGQMFKDTCYVPVFPPRRQPTSHPVHKQ